MMKVTFIQHSSFLAELDHCCLLFDYYEGSVPKTPLEKPLYIFASHSHGDHFSSAVFSLAEPGRKVFYLLSDDIPERLVPEELLENTVFVAPHSTYTIGDLQVATLESTDLGVAFLIECEGRLLYHAGDLNCWVWDGAPRYQNDMMEAQYKKELELLFGKKIDVAFVPLDPRQETDFDLGMRYFLEAAGASYVFPMHMWGDYTVVPLFKSTPTYREYTKQIQNISAPGQTFELDLSEEKQD